MLKKEQKKLKKKKDKNKKEKPKVCLSDLRVSGYIYSEDQQWFFLYKEMFSSFFITVEENKTKEEKPLSLLWTQ